MRNILSIAFIIFISGSAYAQSYGWKSLGTGSSALNANNYIYSMCADPAGNIYAAGNFTDGLGYRYVAKWNGTAWSELGTGSNALKPNGTIYTICSDRLGNIYAAGDFLSNSTGIEYVAKWNGTTWSELGTATSYLLEDTPIKSITVDTLGNVYAPCLDGPRSTIAKWDGTTWSELDVVDFSYATPNQVCLDKNGVLYTSLNYSVYKWNGTSWTPLSSSFGNVQVLYVFDSTNIYTGEYNTISGQYRLGHYNGTAWSIISAFTNQQVLTMCSDTANNLYVGGLVSFPVYAYYVAKYDGTTWSELGPGSHALYTLCVGGYDDGVDALCSNSKGNIFAATSFDINNNWFVAEYDTVSSANIQQLPNGNADINIYPNPADNEIKVLIKDNLLRSDYFVSDVIGRIFLSGKLINTETTVNINDLPLGLYFLQIGEDKKNTYKLIKK